MTRVLLVEDDPTVQAVVEMVLSTEPDFDLVGVTASAEEAILLVASLQPDLVLLDNQLEGRLSGLEAAPQLKAAHPTAVVLLCTALDMQDRATAEPSVDGYLRKERLVDLVEVIEGLLGR